MRMKFGVRAIGLSLSISAIYIFSLFVVPVDQYFEDTDIDVTASSPIFVSNYETKKGDISQSNSVSSSDPKQSVQTDFIDKEILVRFKDSLPESSLDAAARSLAKRYSLIFKDIIIDGRLAKFEVPDKRSLSSISELLKEDADIAYTSLNYVYVPASIPTNDTYKDSLWYLDSANDADIDAPEAWAVSEGGDNQIIVAIIDTGAAYNHGDLAANMWDGTACKDENGNFLGGCLHGYNFSLNTKNPLPTPAPVSNAGHGTHLAGTIGAVKNNNLGIIGVAPNVKIMALRTDWAIYNNVKALDFARHNGAKIVNASYGGGGSMDAAVQVEAIQRFTDAGGIVVAATTNNGLDNDIYPSWPAANTHDNLISVGMTGNTDVLSASSGYGKNSIDLAAPGVGIYSTICSSDCTSGYGSMTGSSMSTAIVSGIAALVWGAHPELSGLGVKNIIFSSGDLLPSLANKTLSGRRANAYNALMSANSPQTYQPNAGYSVGGVIPSSQIATSSISGQVTVNFRVKNSFSNLLHHLQDFSYSLDGGTTWLTPTNGDSSLAFSDMWEGNHYFSSLDYSGPVYSFSFDSRHNDFTNIKNSESNQFRVRFKISDGISTSGFVSSEAVLLNNYLQLNVTQPASVITVDADNYNITGSINHPSTVQIYRGASVIGSVNVAVAGNFSLSVPLLQAQNNDLILKVTETGGALSEKTYNLPTIIESDPPPTLSFVSINGATSSPYYINSLTPSVIVRGEAGMSCRFGVTDLSYSAMSAANFCVVSGDQATCALPNQGIEGSKNVHVSCMDALGNGNGAHDNIDVAFILDITGPSLSFNSIDQFSESPFVIKNSNPLIKVTSELDMACRYSNTNLTYNAMSAVNACVMNDEIATCTLTDQGADGVKTAYISCIDQAGNNSTLSPIEFTLANSAFSYQVGGGGSFVKLTDFTDVSGSKKSWTLYNGTLYALTTTGGANNIGAIISYNPSTGIYQKKYDFTTATGDSPRGPLTELNGKLYGVTQTGGANNNGVIFEYNPTTNIYTKKHDFLYSTGSDPMGPFVAYNGKLYGTTYFGGSKSYGFVFEYNLETNTFANKYEFTRMISSFNIILINDKIYGTLNSLGTMPYGAIFEYNITNNTYIEKYIFKGNSGDTPRDLSVNNGVIYGSTMEGGLYNEGVIFSYNPVNDEYLKIFDFNGTNGSALQNAPLFIGDDFYIQTYAGGANNKGSILECNMSSKACVSKFSFNSVQNGAYPQSTLTVVGSELYGLTSSGGASNFGTIFKWSSNASPEARNIQVTGSRNVGDTLVASYEYFDADGDLEGTSIFQWYRNDAVIDGANALTYTIQAGDAGTSIKFGVRVVSVGDSQWADYLSESLIIYNQAAPVAAAPVIIGEMFAGIRIRASYDYSDVNGDLEGNSLFQWRRNGEPILGATNNTYVLTDEDEVTSEISFEVTPVAQSGQLLIGDPVLSPVRQVQVYQDFFVNYSFNTTDGANPRGALLEYAGKFYGLASTGGVNNFGNIFSFDPETNVYTKEFDFSTADGKTPYGSLIEYNNKLYGTTYAGGTNSRGVLFEYDPATNTYTKKYDFNLSGYQPYGSLMESGGKLYGTTYSGGSGNLGVIFEYDPATKIYTKKYDFVSASGSRPRGSLIESGGKFYGTTSSGGAVITELFLSTI